MFSTHSFIEPYYYSPNPADYEINGFIFIGGMNMVKYKSIRI